jgi:hypothetical protein
MSDCYGITSFCPGDTLPDLSLLAFLRASALTLYLAAMLDRVSPFFTVCPADLDVDDDLT